VSGAPDPIPADQLETPPGYLRWSAEKKQRWLWDLVLATAHGNATLPPLVFPMQPHVLRSIGIVTKKRELEKSLTQSSDLIEKGRPKVIHARGSVATVALETIAAEPIAVETAGNANAETGGDDANLPPEFTGLLAPDGGAIGLIRMSLVGRVKRKAAFTPALALKLLIDGKPSADLLAMNHVVGQGRDFDLFSNSMTNDLSGEHRELRFPQRMMSRLFSRVSAEPRRLTVDHLAGQTRDGRAVDAPVAPTRLVFHPTTEAKRAFSGWADVDFRRVLGEIPAGTKIYDVEAVVGDGKTATVFRIGAIRTTSPFVSSDGGDRLFFRHVQDDD